MNRILLAIGALMLAANVAVADDEVLPVVNDPVGFWDKVKQVVDAAEPRAGAFYNAEAGEWSATTAAKLYTKEIKGYTLEGVAGYGINKLAYVSVETDVLAGISKLTGATLELPWISLNVGPSVGYTWDEQGDGSHFAYGASLNASAKF